MNIFIDLTNERKKIKIVEENIIVERFDANRNNLTFDSYEQVLY